MANKLVMYLLLCLSLILLFSSQQPSKSIFFSSKPEVASSCITGRKLLKVVPAAFLSPNHADKIERFEIKVGLNSGHENREEDQEMIYTADYSRVRTHSSPLPEHPKP
ncbi:uncharacterized protein LOC110023563 [Phalaenopsis equestris]|uniref:uncharacterized protein LOC110023563 n=1 Tax=Phalaenopsis equestris TaxID=78828 RepID=UPI0009E30565|nr:uncharacterized protein LOC110023563 [Phalaenopsis equestris]